ncbi:PREDICTED: uncharacterized protein LOC104586722 [Nelumbo nucifera]|uniref:Uncharacterized protein LOC104586722 n=2 Tax=Nelumbo nucifera TaxID=4432 RepID=A0A1U7YWK0_NELNU|nr:PREDICTED: uncharacterized protein LOC104586722 [Nelumbo nucifera]DAD31148.1 TPA_asm: hypothetical protein HUJ06_009999 [Nelumbo nucifera]
MAATAAYPATAFTPARILLKISPRHLPPLISPHQLRFKSKPSSTFQSSNALPRFFHLSPLIPISPSGFSASAAATATTSNGDPFAVDNEKFLLSSDAEPQRSFGVLFSVVVWIFLSLVSLLACGAARAATDSMRASGFGLKIASALRSSGWPDQAVVFALAMLPVIELRGAIPVGYWMQLKPTLLTVLSILGNMVPVPFIVLYLKRFASFIARKNNSASRFLDLLFERAREKAGPVEEFQWIGLMLFVAVPFPGTGAWTGAIIASVLDMPFWSAFSANLCGVVLAGLLVNLLVNLGLKYAIATGVILFFVSTFMWSILRSFKKYLRSTN